MMSRPLETVNAQENTHIVGSQVDPRSHGPLETELSGHFSNIEVLNERASGCTRNPRRKGVSIAERDR